MTPTNPALPVNAAQLDPNMAPAPDDGGELAWLSPLQHPFEIAGLGWFAAERRFRRLPGNPDWPLRPEVDRLADATAGAQIRFRTDSAAVAVRVTLTGPPSMDQMPATGQCGMDVYVGDFGDQRYWGTARPVLGSTEYSAVLFRATERALRTVTLNLPLYQGVVEVQVGLDPDAEVAAPPPFPRSGRVVIYGTSITHGGCASRPGSAYPAVLGRRLQQEVLNLGFAGNGKGDPEVARILAQLDNVACFVLDYETNVLEVEPLRVTLTNFIPILREQHPSTPILVITKPGFARALHNPGYRATTRERRDLQLEIVERYRAEGDDNLHFLDLNEFDIGEATVDGVHPTDGGFLQLADRIEPELRHILGA